MQLIGKYFFEKRKETYLKIWLFYFKFIYFSSENHQWEEENHLTKSFSVCAQGDHPLLSPSISVSPMVCAPCQGWCKVNGVGAGGSLAHWTVWRHFVPLATALSHHPHQGAMGTTSLKKISESECWSGMQTFLSFFSNCHKGGQGPVVRYLPAEKNHFY